MTRTATALTALLVSCVAIPAYAGITIDKNKIVCDGVENIYKRLGNTFTTFRDEHEKQWQRVIAANPLHPAARSDTRIKLLERMADLTDKARLNLAYYDYAASTPEQTDAHACQVFKAVAAQLDILAHEYNSEGNR